MPRLHEPANLGLHAQAQAQADQDHRRRTAELKTLAPLLAAFQQDAALLAARGLKVYPEQISLRVQQDFSARRSVKLLRLRTHSAFNDAVAGNWLAALRHLGWTEVTRNNYEVTLKAGRLLLCVDTPVNTALEATSVGDYAVRVTAKAGPDALHALAHKATTAAQAPTGSAH